MNIDSGYIDCDCGYEVDVTYPVGTSERWVQCPNCSRLWQVTVGPHVGRAKRAKTQRCQEAIFGVFATNKPQMTVRQVYYALAVRGIVPKTKAGYRQTCYQLGVLRRDGTMPYGWIADNTRWQIKPTTYTGVESAMQIWHDAYRRDMWESQNVHVEIWVEKDALAGVIAPVTRYYGVPLFVARGFSSMTFAYDAAEEIKEIDKPTYIYHFGDFDPSGINAAESLQAELWGHGASASFERIAITREQIDNMGLPTLPVNRKDPRAKTWNHPFVCELDALPVNVLRSLVRECIEAHIDKARWEHTKEAERLERQTLDAMHGYFVQEQKR